MTPTQKIESLRYLAKFKNDEDVLGDVPYTLLEWAADEIERAAEVRAAALNYASGYLLDEMTDPQMCVTPEQHKAAVRLADALGMKV